MVETALAAKYHVSIPAIKSVITRNEFVRKETELLPLLQDYVKENYIQLPYSKDEELIQFIRHALCIV